jgi:hypothetical protein
MSQGSIDVSPQEKAMRTLANFGFAALLVAATPVAAAEVDWSKVDDAFGKKGAMQAGDVYRATFPRTDLQVKLDGVSLKPGFASGTHIEMKATGDRAMMMGDLVLTEAEINPVMKRLLDGGIQVTAVHNHLLRTSPALYYMHVGGDADPVAMAKTLHAALQLSKTPLTAATASPPAQLDLDTAAIESTLWASPTASTSSRPAAARRRSPETSFSRRAKFNPS